MYTVSTPAQLGKILRGQRRAQTLTQKDAAQNVGLLRKTVSKLENQPETATVESLFKLLSALQLELVVRSKMSVVDDQEW